MNAALRDLFVDYSSAFDHRVTQCITAALVVLLLITPIVIQLLYRRKSISEKLHAELILRYKSWLVLTPAIVLPILLGRGWTMLAILTLSLLCYREFARATGIFREKIISFIVVVGIVLITMASLDNWYALFVALPPLTMGVIAIVAVLRDEPHGYIQRVALGVFGFVLFGSCLGHLSYFANDVNYRAILLLLFLSVELNDVFAFMAGKMLGRTKFIPNTSPNKTAGGAIGALILTTILVSTIGHFVFKDTPLDTYIHLITMGILVSVTGQFGDLMLSSIKRDLGLKDMAATIPGHGGLLDRFDSIILAAPILFHYIGYFIGVGVDRAPRMLTGG